MRIGAIAILAILATPCEATAQVGRIPRAGRGASPQPAPLPPEAPVVARALAYKRSRWSGEGYSLISSMQMPGVRGGLVRHTAAGAGTRGAFRYTDRLSATLDATATLPGLSSMTQTAEVGTRFSPLELAHALRPFVDLRAAYMYMSDEFAAVQTAAILGGTSQQFAGGSRYSRGLGAVAGAGVEYSLTNTLAVTTEVSAMRNRMSTYRLMGPADLPSGSTYWMTSFRYTLGLRINPASALHLAQKPTQ